MTCSTIVLVLATWTATVTVRPVVGASDVQPLQVGVEVFVPVIDDVGVTGELMVGAGRGSAYVVGGTVGITSGGTVWLEADGGVGIVQALTKGGLGAGPLSLYAWETELLTQVRGVVGWQVLERFAPFAGVTLNYQVAFSPNAPLSASSLPVPLFLVDKDAVGGGHQLWPGLVIGVKL